MEKFLENTLFFEKNNYLNENSLKLYNEIRSIQDEFIFIEELIKNGIDTGFLENYLKILIYKYSFVEFKNNIQSLNEIVLNEILNTRLYKLYNNEIPDIEITLDDIFKYFDKSMIKNKKNIFKKLMITDIFNYNYKYGYPNIFCIYHFLTSNSVLYNLAINRNIFLITYCLENEWFFENNRKFLYNQIFKYDIERFLSEKDLNLIPCSKILKHCSKYNKLNLFKKYSKNISNDKFYVLFWSKIFKYGNLDIIKESINILENANINLYLIYFQFSPKYDQIKETFKIFFDEKIENLKVFIDKFDNGNIYSAEYEKNWIYLFKKINKNHFEYVKWILFKNNYVNLFHYVMNTNTNDDIIKYILKMSVQYDYYMPYLLDKYHKELKKEVYYTYDFDVDVLLKIKNYYDSINIEFVIDDFFVIKKKKDDKNIDFLIKTNIDIKNYEDKLLVYMGSRLNIDKIILLNKNGIDFRKNNDEYIYKYINHTDKNEYYFQIPLIIKYFIDKIGFNPNFDLINDQCKDKVKSVFDNNFYRLTF